MADIIIFGMEQFAGQMFELLKREAEMNVKAFCADRSYLPEKSEWGGYRLLPLKIWKSILRRTNTAFCSALVIHR